VFEQVEKLTVEAGQMLMSYFKKPDLRITIKADESPVTEADYAVSDFFKEKLAHLNIPVVTEESQPEERPKGDFFIIDPLDGTRYFINGDEHFAVLVALISEGAPIMGFTYFPAMQLMFSAAKGRGSFMNGDKISNQSQRTALIAYSLGFHNRPQGQELIKKLNIEEVRIQESVLKMGYMARGDVDFYPRFGTTYEWDTASGQILLEEAGCQMFDVNTLRPLKYGKTAYKNSGYVAFRTDLAPKVTELFRDLKWRRSSDGH
jgi:3'(2'), 5'-bisphosphate nucleotidase